MSDLNLDQHADQESTDSVRGYQWKLHKEAEFWGTMARLRWRDGIPMTMDFSRATRYRVRRSELGWGDYFQDPSLDACLPYGQGRRRLVARIRAAPGSRSLDLCCGAGWLALEQARAGKQVDAVDLSEEEMLIAKEYQATLTETIPGSIRWIQADLNTYEPQVNEYDLVTVADGLHHLSDINHLCAAIHRGLRPHGKLLITERVWGGQEPSARARIGKYLEQSVWTLLPTPSPYTYGRKFKELWHTYKLLFTTKILRRNRESQPWQLEGEHCSPFEDSCGREMLDVIESYFHIDRIEWYGCFTEEIQRSLYLPRVMRWPVLLLLGWVDQIFIATGLLEGKLLILYGHKRTTAPGPLLAEAK